MQKNALAAGASAYARAPADPSWRA